MSWGLTKILAIVSLTAISVAAVQTWRMSLWKDRAQEAESLVLGYQEAARMRADQDERQRRLRDEAASIDLRIINREGGDAPLSDFLRDAARDVWP